METKLKPTQFDQYIQYKSLSFKFAGHSLPDSLIDKVIEESNAPVKNVCAKLHVDLSNRLDNTVGVLQMSKRKFIELALIEAMNKADEIMNEVDIAEYLSDDENSDHGESK